jgi:hypothetical protein
MLQRFHKMGTRARASRRVRTPHASRRRAGSPQPLFGRPRSCVAQWRRFGREAAFDLHRRLQPGPRHFQQDLAVPFRFGLAGPTQALLRELAEFLGGCRHGALLLTTGGSARGLSATGACMRDGAGDNGNVYHAEDGRDSQMSAPLHVGALSAPLRHPELRLVMSRASAGRCGEVVVDQPQYSVSGIRLIRALTYLAMRQS